jgi:uncharacterized protein YecT (DUF1311 family)
MKRWAFVVCLTALAGPAQAFDCAKASTKAEKAICADPAARAADDELSKAFAAAISVMSPSDKTAAVTAQVKWIAMRDGACTDLLGSKYSACLATQSMSRRAFLAAEPEAGPGAPGRLEPTFRQAKGDKRKAALDLQLLKYPSPATPAERAFNAAVDRAVGPLDEPDNDDPGITQWEYERTMRLPFASPRLISAHLEAYSATGGAHPNSYTADINVLIEEGREAKLADLLDDKAAQKVFAFCLKSVRKDKKDRMGADFTPEEDLPKTVAEATAKLETWGFGANSARVSYDPYAVGSYAEGAYDCVIPYSTLKPLARPSFPLP